MIADSPSLKEAGPISFAGEILDMGMLLSLGSDAQDPLLLASIRGQAMDTDPLYGIFTSGSTGAPKGVVVDTVLSSTLWSILQKCSILPPGMDRQPGAI